MTYTQVAYWNLIESNRANLARETETARNNKAVLAEQKRNNIANLNEQTRTHKVNEQIAQDTLAETIRANKAREAYQQASINLGFAQLAETSFANRQSEAIRWAQNYETARNNSLQIGLGYANLGEVNRSNLQNEIIKRQANTNAWLNYTVASNNYQEQRRHNLAMERQASVNNVTGAVVTLGSSLLQTMAAGAKSGAAAIAGGM